MAYYRYFLILTTILAFFYFLWGINSWKFSYVGDVWQFYQFAIEILQKNFLMNPFSFEGVFYQNSVLASFYQAIFLKLFGISNLSWRLSNIILIIPISYFFYQWVKASFDREIAIISTLLLQSSFFLANFFKIGYINPEAFALFILTLFLSSYAGRHPTKRNGILLGFVLGVSFYIYIGPVFPLIIWPYLLPLLFNKQKKYLSSFFLPLIITYVLLLSPLLINLNDLQGPLSKTATHKEFSSNSIILQNIFHNFLVFYKNYNAIFTHFIAPVPYLDRISQVFAFIGTISLLVIIIRFKTNAYISFLLIYISTCIVLGLTNPYTNPPTTRGMFFLPFGFCLVALGLSLLRSRGPLMKGFMYIILAFIMLVNISQSQIGSFDKIGYTGMALIMKNIQEAHNKQTKPLVLIVSDTASIYSSIPHLSLMQQAYAVSDVKFHTLKPEEATCEQLFGEKILVLNTDHESKEWLTKLDCNPKPLNYEVLSPQLTYY